MSEPTRAVVYAALSKKGDPDQASIASQHQAVRGRLDRLAGRTVVGTFKDDGYSGSKRNRGPGLERAIALAVESAPCELWANTSQRFARGSGRKDEARSLLELFTAMRRAGVTLRTVHDDEFVRNEMLIGFASAQASKYSADLSESVRRAKQRQLDAGRLLGGPLPDGYVRHDDEVVLCPDRFPVVCEVLALADDGTPDAAIAKRMNEDGYRTRSGIPWTRRAVQALVTNPFYAGQVAYKRGTPDERMVPGPQEAIIELGRWQQLQQERGARDRAPSARKTGRPNTNHALARLATCAHCGGRMGAFTSSYVRKDGSRRRFYRCVAAHDGSGICDAIHPIDAEPVDAAVIAGLDTLLVDFDAWAARIRDEYGQERARLEAEVERAERSAHDQGQRAEKVAARWAELVAADDPRADAVLPQVEREQQASRDAGDLLSAVTTAAAAVPTGTPTDGMLDFANALGEAVRGAATPGTPLVEVNAALRSLFSEFRIKQLPGDGVFSGTYIEPWLLAEAIPHGGDWPKLVPPPLRDLGPEQNEQHTQA